MWCRPISVVGLKLNRGCPCRPLDLISAVQFNPHSHCSNQVDEHISLSLLVHPHHVRNRWKTGVFGGGGYIWILHTAVSLRFSERGRTVGTMSQSFELSSAAVDTSHFETSGWHNVDLLTAHYVSLRKSVHAPEFVTSFSTSHLRLYSVASLLLLGNKLATPPESHSLFTHQGVCLSFR